MSEPEAMDVVNTESEGDREMGIISEQNAELEESKDRELTEEAEEPEEEVEEAEDNEEAIRATS